MRKIINIFIVLISFSSASFAQIDTVLVKRELMLENLLKELRSVKNDSVKEKYNEAFRVLLEETILLPGAFDYPFQKLKTLGSIKSPDNAFRLFNWNVEQDDLTQKYYCYILRFDERKKEYFIKELIDNSIMLPEKPDDILDAENWYGALYYQIIPFEKGKKDMYTLLGWDGHTSMSNMKLIDVLYFSGNNPKLGSPVFKVGSSTFKRIFYEHSEKAIMSLRYDEKYERILFDHLSPESANLKGFYAYYVPDMSYDAFRLKNGKWYLEEDVIAVNPQGSDKLDIFVPDEKSGEVVSKKMKNKWMDPSDDKSPAGGNVHVARKPELPDGKDGKEIKEKKKKRGWFKFKKDKRDPSKLYPYNDLKKSKRKKRN
jgi:hypothetical protein